MNFIIGSQIYLDKDNNREVVVCLNGLPLRHFVDWRETPAIAANDQNTT